MGRALGRVGCVTSATPAQPPLLDTVVVATDRLLDTVRKLTTEDVAAPSLLPGWTRGHVLTHLARNADSLVNLLLWARTGIETPQYASLFLRDADIENGAPRPIAEQLADNEAAAARWLALAKAFTPENWQATVRTRAGREIPATEICWMRLREVEIHHVDLAVDYQPADWPTDFVTRLLPEVAATLTPKSESPTFTIQATDLPLTATIGTATPTTTITGPATALLAWLLGRSTGATLTGDLPPLPTWL